VSGRPVARRPLAVVAAGLVLLLVGLTFDTAPLLVPAVAFVALGVVLPVLVRAVAAGASVARIGGEAETVEGARYRSAVNVTAGPLGLIGAEVRDPIAGQSVPVRCGVSWRRRRVMRFEVVTSFPRRGLVHLDPPVLSVNDPLGLQPVERRAPETPDVLVLPAVSEVRWRAAGGRDRSHGEVDSARAEALAAVEIDGLRPYRPGTPASRIHWPALARGAGLLERRMRAEEDARPLVVLDTRCPGEGPAALDAPVRAAASLVLALARQGGCSLLVGEDPRPLQVDARLTGWHAARRRLALAEPGDHAPALAGARGAQVHYVMAAPDGRAPQALRTGGGVLVRPSGAATAGRPSGPVVVEVAGCVGVALAPRRLLSQGEAVRA
jgi:uncharacterized protein (DUF58 family)